MPEDQESGPTVIVVFAGKGGVAKTTTSFLLAWCLGQIASTLLVNADPRQVEGSASDLHDRLAVPATFDLVEEEDPKQLAKVRDAKRRTFVVVDTAPDRDKDRIKATLQNADLVVVPLTMEWLEAKAVMNAIQTYVRPSGRPYRIVLSRVPYPKQREAKHVRLSLETGGHKLLRTTMRQYSAHGMAQADGVPVTEGDWVNWDKAAVDTYDMVDDVLEALGRPERVTRRAR